MRILSITFIIFLAFIDYLSKALIKANIKNDYYVLNEYISFHAFYNKGIAFSFFDSESIQINNIVALVISIIILFIFYVFLRDFNKFKNIEVLGYVCILGGAVGNFLDRIQNGSVLDFIIVNYSQIYFPAIFNVADILISFGALLLVYTYLFITKI